MNNAIVVNDSISPSTQYNVNRKSTNDGYSTSFRDAMAANARSSEDEVNISSSAIGKFVISSALIVPAPEELNELMCSLSQSLTFMFNQNGIPKDPPIELGYDKTNDSITVTGERDDLDKISSLINSDDKLKNDIKTAFETSYSMVNLGESYRDYKNSAKEYDDFGEPVPYINDQVKLHTVSLTYDGQMSLSADGEAYSVVPGNAESDEAQSERDDIFVRINELLMLKYLSKYTGEEEEEDDQSDESGESGIVDESSATEEDEARYEYTKILREIERTKEEALERLGTDKNRYALAIEIYNKVQQTDERSSEKIQMNNSVLESAEENSANSTA